MNPKREDALFSAHAILAALKSSIRVLRWGMLALVLIYLGSGITVVGPEDTGLILRFGKLLPEIHQPGLLFSLPAPIDEVIMVPSKRVQEVSLDAWSPAADEPDYLEALHPARNPYTLTGDTNIIRARFSVRYQVSDPIAYVFGSKDRDALRDSILYEVACRTLAGMPVDDVLTTRREFVGQETMRLAQAEFDRLGLGIGILAVETREISPPAQVLAAFQDVISAKVEAKTLVEPANARRASEIPNAESEAYRVRQQASADAQELVAKAHGEAFSFLALLKEYRENPEVVHARLYAEMLEAVLPKVRVSAVIPASNGEVKIMLAPQKWDSSLMDESTAEPPPAQPPPEYQEPAVPSAPATPSTPNHYDPTTKKGPVDD